MLDFISQVDTKLFIFVNHLPHNILLDVFFSFLSGIGSLGLVWITIGILLLAWEEIFDRRGFYALILAGLATLFLVELGLKNIFRRLRPEFVILHARVLGHLTKSFSFPSGHATISFAAAYILSKTHKKSSLFYYILAILISFSRIYLGKHYPSDVLAGAFVGFAIGYFSLKISRFKANRVLL